MQKLSLTTAAVLSLLTVAGCGSSSSNSGTVPAVTPTPTPTPTPASSLSDKTVALGIVPVPNNLSNTYTTALKFNRYTSVIAPNGGEIGIVAQDGLTDNQIVRARSILAFYLTNVPGTKYGSDKSAVANKLAANGAKLLLLNGVDDGTNAGAELDGQPLYFGELQVEGGAWYINQNYEHRDASYEEILHFVHDYGIGVDQNPSFIGALPDYQAEIRAAEVDASAKKLWGIGQDSWLQELTAENSLTQEYLAAVIDSYYGLWGAWQPETDAQKGNGMWGLYVGKDRIDTANDDPMGTQVVQQFFSPVITYNARIDETFKGIFTLSFDTALPYTHHSQYLKDITLTGNNASGVKVNQYNNNITGNDAENTVYFSGNYSEYQISFESDAVIVKDLQDDREGTNTLTSIEKLSFSDTVVNSPTE
mgnify:CR=1 FL=1